MSHLRQPNAFKLAVLPVDCLHNHVFVRSELLFLTKDRISYGVSTI